MTFLILVVNALVLAFSSIFMSVKHLHLIQREKYIYTTLCNVHIEKLIILPLVKFPITRDNS